MIFEKRKFENLAEFMTCMEKCPLCDKRNSLEILPFMDGALIGNEVVVTDDRNPNGGFSINLYTNKITGSISVSDSRSLNEILIRSICRKKFHFFYDAICDISKDKAAIENIELEKYHFNRQFNDTTHFSVKSLLLNNLTIVSMTKNFQTKTISLPLVNFDFSSEKKIDKKLKHIQLLG